MYFPSDLSVNRTASSIWISHDIYFFALVRENMLESGICDPLPSFARPDRVPFHGKQPSACWRLVSIDGVIRGDCKSSVSPPLLRTRPSGLSKRPQKTSSDFESGNCCARSTDIIDRSAPSDDHEQIFSITISPNCCDLRDDTVTIHADPRFNFHFSDDHQQVVTHNSRTGKHVLSRPSPRASRF